MSGTRERLRIWQPAAEEADPWLLWQLADSAFPAGGFAHSAGLESAWQHGEVATRAELDSYVAASLEQVGRAALPFVTAVHDEPDKLREIDELCDAFTNNHIANRASRAQGRAYYSAWNRIFKARVPACDGETAPAFGHFAPIYGFCLRRLGISRRVSSRLFLFNHLRGLLAAAVRLNIVGPMEAQSAQGEMSVYCESLLTRCELLSVNDLSQTSPLLDIWQGSHDRLYSRLFQS